MHGDFEAQRHWMEITAHLPISQWYFHDLEWWGLDYPPLTAYHSWLLGIIGSWINPAWFALYSSRQLDDPSLKIYMRTTVFVSEYLVFVPAAVICLRRFTRMQGVQTWESYIALTTVLLQPANLLIDHGHFQYNTVMLGLVLASMSSAFAGRLLWASVFFVAALGFKQMALYYAPAIFACLLGACLSPHLSVLRFFRIAIITLLSFVILLAPLLAGSLYDAYRGIAPIDAGQAPLSKLHILSALPVLGTLQRTTSEFYDPLIQQIDQLLHRVFPFARGLFEDKVANVWCTLNLFVKLRNYSTSILQGLSLLATVTAILPPCVIIFRQPRVDILPHALATTAWGFFLCSFQVHEKSVLLPLLPTTILLSMNKGFGRSVRAWVGFANMLGVWTMFPLLKRDGLVVPYIICSGIWSYLLGLPPTNYSLYISHAVSKDSLYPSTACLQLAFYAIMGLWHLGEANIPPPSGKPDLWPVINAAVGAAGFGVCYLWCLWEMALASRRHKSPPQVEEQVKLKKLKPRNARSKRALDKQAPKPIENPKISLFLKGSTCSEIVGHTLRDLHSLKRPLAIKFSKKNDIHPFDNVSSLEFFSAKNDASLLVFGHNSKKRPHSLTLLRMFDHKLLDMIELHVDPESFRSLTQFKNAKYAIGMKPLIQFSGTPFESPDSESPYMLAKSMFTDFFRGPYSQEIDVEGLQYIISIMTGDEVAGEAKPAIHLRVYLIKTRKSGHKLPRVDVEEMGPRIDFRIGRMQVAEGATLKEAMRKPSQLLTHQRKNVGTDIVGDKIGRIHLGKQNLSELETRKMKGLKRKRDIDSGGEEELLTTEEAAEGNSDLDDDLENKRSKIAV
ncbi:MAG: Glucosyltransferase-like protein [Trizodia sp. TS-e1964]|nr:MAG: Glucosyltransferase-like protein [Trizodia sp. TS-e1964]